MSLLMGGISRVQDVLSLCVNMCVLMTVYVTLVIVGNYC